MSRQFVISVLIWLATLPLIAAVLGYALMWGTHRWNSPAWLIACSVAAAGSQLIAWRAARRWTASHFRFSLGGLLIAMACVAVFLATFGRWWLDFFGRDHAIRTVVGAGAYVQDIRIFQDRRNESALFKWIGYDPFDKERILEIRSDEAVAELLARPSHFQNFTYLSFDRGTTTAGFEQAEKLNQLTNVSVGQFMNSAIDDRGLAYLRKWTRATELFFNGCSNITDAGLVHFTEMPQLTRLSFVGEAPGISITDAGLVHVGKMKPLKYLMLLQLPQITDAGLEHLHGLTNLEYAVIRYTGATDDGLLRLMEALPDCHFYTDGQFPIPGRIQRMVLRESSKPDAVLADISDPDRIGEILAMIETLRTDDAWRSRGDDPSPARYVLQFMGARRDYYEVRIGDGALQQKFVYWQNWAKWSLSQEQLVKLLELVQSSADGEEMQ